MMMFSTSPTTLLAIRGPVSLPDLQTRQKSGSYTFAGLGARKKQVTAAGADSFNLAIAMLETEKMDTSYPYDDKKQNNAANFGIFGQNWGVAPRLLRKVQRAGSNGLEQWRGIEVRCSLPPFLLFLSTIVESR